MTQFLSVVLAISLLCNFVLGRFYLDQRDKATTAVVEEKHSNSAATACSTAVDAMETVANKRHSDAAPKVKAAKDAAVTADKAADVVLSTPATVPGDDCKSAQDRVNAWWSKRTTP